MLGEDLSEDNYFLSEDNYFHDNSCPKKLLIGDDPKVTSHPRIMKASERFVPWSHLEKRLNELSQALAVNDVEHMLTMLQELVVGYQREATIVDWVHLQAFSAET